MITVIRCRNPGGRLVTVVARANRGDGIFNGVVSGSFGGLQQQLRSSSTLHNWKQSTALHASARGSDILDGQENKQKQQKQLKLDPSLVTRSHVRLFHSSTFLLQDEHQPTTPTSKEPLPLAQTKPRLSVWEQAQSIPNRITLTRLACAPILCGWILNEQFAYALAGCTVAGFSDWLDGYLAKNYDGRTPLGSYMDPLADKAIVNSLAVSLCHVGALPTPLVGIWLLKDTILVSCTLYVVAKNQRDDSLIDKTSSFWYPASPLKIEPTFISKVNTVLQFGTLGVAIVNPLYPMPELLQASCWVTGATTIASTFSYWGLTAFSKS